MKHDIKTEEIFDILRNHDIFPFCTKAVVKCADICVNKLNIMIFTRLVILFKNCGDYKLT